MYRLMLICIIVCSAFGCVTPKDVSDAGTDAQEDGACGLGYTVWEECREMHWQWIRVRADCSEDRGEMWCFIKCDDAGVACEPVPR